MSDEGWTDTPIQTSEQAKELARQLLREHREGIAADRLERECRTFAWDIEGWTGDDELALYIAGSGLHRIPADEVVRLANAMLAEHELRFDDRHHPDRWRTNATGSLVCPHRNMSVCPDCAEHPDITDVAGAHFYDPDGKIREATDDRQ